MSRAQSFRLAGAPGTPRVAGRAGADGLVTLVHPYAAHRYLLAQAAGSLAPEERRAIRFLRACRAACPALFVVALWLPHAAFGAGGLSPKAALLSLLVACWCATALQGATLREPELFPFDGLSAFPWATAFVGSAIAGGALVMAVPYLLGWGIAIAALGALQGMRLRLAAQVVGKRALSSPWTRVSLLSEGVVSVVDRS